MAEITVRGAGIFGLSIAWICAQRGAKVRVIDPAGVGAGSSGGIVGALAPHVPEKWNAKKAFQLESLLMAEGFWSAVQAASGLSPGYIRSGRLQPIADTAALELAHARHTTARTLWRDTAKWEVVAKPGEAWGPQSPTGWVIHDTLSALVHPHRACAALAGALKNAGVDIARDAPDQGQIVWATGIAGLDQLSVGRSRAVGTGIKGQAALLKYEAAGAPQIFANGIHIIPHLNGTVAVGSTSERHFVSGTDTDMALDAVVNTARLVLPALKDAPVITTWASVRPRARSRAPMLGAWPGRPGHFIANGGFKIGFGMAPKVAETMADLLLKGACTVPNGFEVAASF